MNYLKMFHRYKQTYTQRDMLRMECYSPTRKKEILPFLTTWVDLEDIMLKFVLSFYSLLYSYNQIYTMIYILKIVILAYAFLTFKKTVIILYLVFFK